MFCSKRKRDPLVRYLSGRHASQLSPRSLKKAIQIIENGRLDEWNFFNSAGLRRLTRTGQSTPLLKLAFWSFRGPLPVKWQVGLPVGLQVGQQVGQQVGLQVGLLIGLPFGLQVGFPVGLPVRLQVGVPVGLSVGLPVGLPLGLPVGLPLGLPVGLSVGLPVGLISCTATTSQGVKVLRVRFRI
jgi:hypothetical protein